MKPMLAPSHAPSTAARPEGVLEPESPTRPGVYDGAFSAPSVSELERLCAEHPLNSVEEFSGNDFYAMAAVLKRYAGLPKEWPLPAVLPHGAHCASNIWEEELRHPLPHVLLWSEDQRELYARVTQKSLHVIGSPLLYAARLIEAELTVCRKEAAGTLVFPVHSTHHLTARYDEGEFIARIADLPDEFHPIRICLYWRDVQLGRHHRWREAGFPCVSAGHMFDPEFPFRLLRLVASHSRAAANEVGTAALCASVLGLPVKMLRQPSSHDGSDARFMGELAPRLDLPVADAFHRSADLPLDRASEVQRPFACQAFGMEALLSPTDLHDLIQSLDSDLRARGQRRPAAALATPSYPSPRDRVAALVRLLPALAQRVGQCPRRKPGQLDLDGRSLAYADFHSLYYQADQIFRNRLYDLAAAGDSPVILDCGAHIGLAALSFAARHPRAVIHAFEADPSIAHLLARNVAELNLHQVTVHPQAVWTHDQGVSFNATADDSGHLAEDGATKVPSVRLRDILQREPVDLLKLDIEGAEYQVLRDCDGALARVRNLVIEAHQFRETDGRLGDLLSVLERNGFDYTLGDLHAADWIPSTIRPPFEACSTRHFIVTVFAWKRDIEKPQTASQRKVPASAWTAIADGVTHLNAGRSEQAIDAFHQALQLHPDNHRIHFGRSIALARSGRRDDARAALARVTAIEPTFAKARQLLVELNLADD